MLNMNYIGDSTIYPIEFTTISDYVVQLKGDFPTRTDGFLLSRSSCKDNWDYGAYTTIYQKIDGGTQFSNNGSVYVPCEQIPDLEYPDCEPYEPALEEVEEMEQKRKEQEAIPTNAELSVAVMEIAENLSDIQDAVAELGMQVTNIGGEI